MTYCSKCGKETAGGSTFCSSCGAALSGPSGRYEDQNYGQQNQYESSNYNQNQDWSNNFGPNQGGGPRNNTSSLGGTLTVILVLGILWAIISIISGLACIFGGGFLFSFFAGPVLIIIGILSFVSGLFALLSCMNIFRLEKHHDAYIYCLIGSILGLITGGIIAGAIGIAFAFILKKEQYRFKS
ncbi:MAG: zinc ribbon domain-containing protein [Candidatus Methanoplasma sp.]|jgi:hypothetical protein|nr:zinc ribbon domain-containing protein [Candidatus Methanoplasma sp.]